MTLLQDRVNAIIDRVVSPGMASGLFDSVPQAEPMSAPYDTMYAVFVAGIGPARSGLDMTSVKITLTGRIHKRALAYPRDLIDPWLLTATATMMAAYSEDFELGGEARMIDLLGANGGGALAGRAGHITIDKTLFRIMDITIPIIVNDAFTQAP